MKMGAWAVLGLVAALSACSTPQTLCERSAATDLRALDTRIATAERDMARGYRIIPAQTPETRLRLCAWPVEPVLFCTEKLRDAAPEKRVAVDIAAATQELDDLRKERAALAIRTSAAQAQCH